MCIVHIVHRPVHWENLGVRNTSPSTFKTKFWPPPKKKQIMQMWRFNLARYVIYSSKTNSLYHVTGTQVALRPSMKTIHPPISALFGQSCSSFKAYTWIDYNSSQCQSHDLLNPSTFCNKKTKFHKLFRHFGVGFSFILTSTRKKTTLPGGEGDGMNSSIIFPAFLVKKTWVFRTTAKAGPTGWELQLGSLKLKLAAGFFWGRHAVDPGVFATLDPS